MQLITQNLEAGYGSRPVLRAISLTMESGQFIGILGPNGCGKSTLLRCLSGIHSPTAGDVTLDGIRVCSLPSLERARRIAAVPQNEPATFDFTAGDIVMMGRYALKRTKRGTASDHEEAVTRAMTATDTLRLRERVITGLSGGEHRRILLARALAQNTPILLLDEPTAHLDLLHQVEMLEVMRVRAEQDGMLVIAALHDLQLASEYCTSMVLMTDGKLVAYGSPVEVVIPRYLSEVFGAPMSVIPGPISGRPHVFVTPYVNSDSPGKRVHVVCGGGSGVELISALNRRGLQVSVGPLNYFDADEVAAAALGIDCVREVPFAPMSRSVLEKSLSLICSAGVVVVSSIAIGSGNIANLELVLKAQALGATAFVLDDGRVQDRDFSSGKGTELWQQICSTARCFKGSHELESELILSLSDSRIV